MEVTTAVNELMRLMRLTVKPESVPPAHDDVPSGMGQVLYGEPQTILAIGGLGSVSQHLTDMGKEAMELLPPGSEFVIYEPGTKVQFVLGKVPEIGPFRGGIADIRGREISRVSDKIAELSDSAGKPITVFGWSMGGVLGLEGWLNHPDDVGKLVTAGSPLSVPGVGVTERPDNGLFIAVRANNDRIVPRRYATNGKEDAVVDVPGGHFGLVTRAEPVRRIIHLFPS